MFATARLALNALESELKPVPVLLLESHHLKHNNFTIGHVPVDEIKRSAPFIYVAAYNKRVGSVTRWGYYNTTLIAGDKDGIIMVLKSSCSLNKPVDIHHSFNAYKEPMPIPHTTTIESWHKALLTRLFLYEQLEHGWDKQDLFKPPTNVQLNAMMYMPTQADVIRDSMSYYSMIQIMGLNSITRPHRDRWLMWERAISMIRLQSNVPSRFLHTLPQQPEPIEGSDLVKIRFELALDLLRTGSYYMENGFLHVPPSAVTVMIQQQWKQIHSSNILRTDPIHPETALQQHREVYRYSILFVGRFKQLIMKITSNHLRQSNIEQLKSVMPACMLKSFDIDTNTGHQEWLKQKQRTDLYMYLLNCGIPVTVMESILKPKVEQVYGHASNTEWMDRKHYLLALERKIKTRITPEVKQFKSCKKFKGEGACPYAASADDKTSWLICKKDYMKKAGIETCNEPIFNPFQFTYQLMNLQKTSATKRKVEIEYTK